MAGETYIFDGESATRISRAVRTVEAMPRGGWLDSLATKVVRPEQTQYIRVTSATPTSGLYPAKIQSYNFSSAGSTIDGTATAWAFSSDGALTTGYYHGRRLAILGSDQQPIFAVDRKASGGGSITVQDNASPTPNVYTGITTIQVNIEDGLTLSASSSTATIDVQSASGSRPGIVTTGSQSFAGAKTFAASITADAGMLVAGGYISFSDLTAVAGSLCGIGEGSDLSVTDSGSTMMVIGAPNGDASNSDGAIYLDVTGSTGIYLTGAQNATSPNVPSYNIIDLHGTTHKGASGTFTTADGKTVTVLGGVIISIV